MNRAVLIVLDGFGIGKDSPFNAINNARMPFYRELIRKYPHSQLLTHGEAVGLPDGVMGNSEVGHMTMGAGRVIYQDLTRISKTIRDGSFFRNEVIRANLEAGARSSGRVHFMGLLSDGGVHSHIDHLLALLTFAQQLKVPEIFVHAFTDGRDTPPHSGVKYMRQLLEHPAFSAPPGQSRARIATISGRYYAMDRDKRWERVERAYKALTGQGEAAGCGALEVLEKSYKAEKTDEFIEPTIVTKDGAISDGDSVFFFNYRSDRARELSIAFTAREFTEFPRGPALKLAAYGGMAVYDQTLKLPAAYTSQNLDHIFGEWLEERGLSQFRVAETEKYAHVTFFFNGGREKAFEREDRILVPSPRDVATYDLKPEMSAFQVAEEAASRILKKQYDFVLMNFANADMVGHTGNYAAAVQAMEALDKCLEKVISAAEKSGYHVLVTADHGNAEEMTDGHGHLHTQHTLNPVPAIWIPPGSAIAPKNTRVPLKDGSLQDIMPTLCGLMGLPLPSEVTGKSLIP